MAPTLPDEVAVALAAELSARLALAVPLGLAEGLWLALAEALGLSEALGLADPLDDGLGEALADAPDAVSAFMRPPQTASAPLCPAKVTITKVDTARKTAAKPVMVAARDRARPVPVPEVPVRPSSFLVENHVLTGEQRE